MTTIYNTVMNLCVCCVDVCVVCALCGCVLCGCVCGGWVGVNTKLNILILLVLHIPSLNSDLIDKQYTVYIYLLGVCLQALVGNNAHQLRQNLQGK